MWSIFEQSQIEDETISNAFSSRGIFKIQSAEEVIKALISMYKNCVLLIFF